MATTGLRRGEVAGLLWSAVDLDKGELMVRHTLSRVGAELLLTEPKTDRSRRRVPLHAGVVTQLRAHRTRQLQERLQAGDQWTDTGAVFATEFGTMVDPRNLLRAVEIAARKAGIEDVGAHTMRHCAAVAWLESGVHIKAAADLLGHASISITGDLYGHTSDDTARAAVDGLGRRSDCELVRYATGGYGLGTGMKKAAPDLRKPPLTCVGLTGFEPATT